MTSQAIQGVRLGYSPSCPHPDLHTQTVLATNSSGEIKGIQKYVAGRKE